MSNKGFYYFAHPYTAKDKDGNYVPRAEDANFTLCNIRAGVLLELGYNVYSPISHTHPIHNASPAFLSRHEHDMWYHLDMDFIAKTNFDGIILAPGWEKSKGCCMEREWFNKKGLRVYLYEDIVKAPAGEKDNETPA